MLFLGQRDGLWPMVDMDLIEIVVPESNGEAVLLRLAEKMSLGYGNG
jgi:hypothetical protein